MFLTDDNVDEAPVCAFSGNDELAPEGQPDSVVFCTAEHTVTQDEIDAEEGVFNTATVRADELDPVMTSMRIPVALFDSGFESPPNTITVIDDPDNTVGRFSDIAIRADGKPVIAYLDDSDGVLLVAKCNDEACRDGDETISFVDDGNVGAFSSIAIGFDGLPVISYHDRANGKLKVAHCNDAACSGEDEIVTTLNDAEASTGVNTSIAVGDDGYPVISYQQITSPWDGVLKVAKCNDASCVGGDETITALDTTGGPLFESTALVIGADGNPVIAYKDTVAEAITVVKCNDPACAGGDESLQAVDFNSTYMRVSLALAPDGNPLVSYPACHQLLR